MDHNHVYHASTTTYFYSQISSIVFACETASHFAKIRIEMTKQGLTFGVFCMKYVWGCFTYCSQWLLVIVLSSYIEGLVEIIYDKHNANGSAPSSEEASPVQVSAISMMVLSNFLIAFLVSLLVQSDRKAPSLKPWLALLLTTITLQISDRVNGGGAKAFCPSSSSASIAPEEHAAQEYQSHINQLSCPLGERSVALMVGALCAVYLLRDDIQHTGNA